MTDLDALRMEYTVAAGTEDYETHARFVKALLAKVDPETVAFHFDLLRERGNRDLNLRLRAAFIKRGEPGARFLVARIDDEADPVMRGELLHLLGRLRHPAALPLARQALDNDDPDLRHRGCYVLGWIGEATDVRLLGERLRTDPSPMVRGTAATAHSQLHDHLPDAGTMLLENLVGALVLESEEGVAGWIVVTVQIISGKRFGLKEDLREGALRGDIPAARGKCLKAFGK